MWPGCRPPPALSFTTSGRDVVSNVYQYDVIQDVRSSGRLALVTTSTATELMVVKFDISGDDADVISRLETVELELSAKNDDVTVI